MLLSYLVCVASLKSWVLQWQKVKVRDHFNEGCAGIPEKRKLLLILGLASSFVFNPKNFMEIVNFVFKRE